MSWGLRPLLSGSTYTGVLLAWCGALASLVLQPFALVPAMAWQSGPEGARIALALLIWAVLVAAVGAARTTRRVLIVAVRRLLRVPLPDPVAGRAPGTARWRTSVWMLLHVALGWLAALVPVLLIMAVCLPGGWLGGELRLSLFGWSVRVTDGGWSWAVALGCLLLAPVLCAAVTGVLRWAAPRLLGPSPAELLVHAAERERLLAERNELAHELHDSIGHTLTAATIQAAVAGEMLATDPVAARAALRSIEESTRAALEDLDHVLGVLREEAAGTAPTRTLADLPELLDRVRHTGAVVEPELSGDLTAVPATVSRAAYRILQEGLTNALRHGARGPVQVRLVATADAVDLEVVNRTGTPDETDSAARTFPTSGHGLPGLAERVRLLRGQIESGPTEPRHWRLAVRLPLRLSE
ncbi:two-component sensor histidine kinase [Rhodococcus sp. D2-41]|uniref:histidine kinase n=1 Tax=Speluncibacter jeojiensis TaxID=2710754 RepID=A0A9X4RCG7_9ACTN|nr:histidine kinase [Rhodococcus sp. D2-41]MDG3008750.1 two-component sensor histidine kinase [Rhodococcus sp. D2-41]MDG3013042.1 histidine kinase [Corynebacteriales bacterium D3-21]